MTERRASELGFLIIPRFMLAAIALVAVLHVVAFHFWPPDQNNTYNFWRELFDVSLEANFPTWVACVYWLIMSTFAFLCYGQSKGLKWFFRLPWIGVGLIFGCASLDEIAEIHESVGHILQKPQIASGNPKYLYEGSPGSPWIAFYAPFLILAIVAMLVFFWRSLPRRYFVLAMCGFACFGFSIGCDFFQGMHEANRVAIAQAMQVEKDWLVDTSVYVEELVELLGMTLLAWAFIGKYETTKRMAAGACPPPQQEETAPKVEEPA